MAKPLASVCGPREVNARPAQHAQVCRSQSAIVTRLRLLCATDRQQVCSSGLRLRALGARSRGRPAAAAVRDASTPSKGKVLVVPAYYTDASEFRGFVKKLRQKGYDAALPPIRWYNWVPTLGGRSVRPILDRMDYAVTQLLEGTQVSEATGYEIPLPQPATTQDFLQELKDASQGAVPPIPLTGRWSGGERVAIIASSAAGWISRIFLGSGPQYHGDTVYYGSDRVHTLVTLGSPHRSEETVTKRNIDYVNQTFPGAFEKSVRYVVVGSKAVQGKAWLGNTVQDLAWQSYAICCGKGDAWGDGIIPVECALDLDGAEKILLDGARHVPMDERGGNKWYGSDEYLQYWEQYLTPPVAASTSR